MSIARATVLASFALMMTGSEAQSSPSAPPASTAPSVGANAVRSSVDECVTCHADVAEQWAASLHRASFRDPSFQRGYAIEPEPFCRDCHAPKGEFDHGVACVSCHGSGPHDSTQSAAVEARDACASCHEFSFEGVPRPPPRPSLMQLTVTEHRESAFAGVTCVECHMPRDANGKRNHRFDVSRNHELLRAAVAIVDAQATENEVIVTLAPRGVGHAFPTGDMFRRLVVMVEDVDGPRKAERRLTRSFGPGPDGTKRTTRDTRLRAPTTFRFALRSASKSNLRVRVLYQRLISAGLELPSHSEPPRESLEDEVLLAERVLPARHPNALP